MVFMAAKRLPGPTSTVSRQDRQTTMTACAIAPA